MAPANNSSGVKRVADLERGYWVEIKVYDYPGPSYAEIIKMQPTMKQIRVENKMKESLQEHHDNVMAAFHDTALAMDCDEVQEADFYGLQHAVSDMISEQLTQVLKDLNSSAPPANNPDHDKTQQQPMNYAPRNLSSWVIEFRPTREATCSPDYIPMNPAEQETAERLLARATDAVGWGCLEQYLGDEYNVEDIYASYRCPSFSHIPPFPVLHFGWAIDACNMARFETMDLSDLEDDDMD